MLHTRNNPGFFKDTVVEQAVVGPGNSIARCERIDDFIMRMCQAMGDDPDLRSRFTQENDGWSSDRFLRGGFSASKLAF